MLYTVALACAPRILFAKSQFLLPVAKFFTARIRTASRKLYLSGAVGDLYEKSGTFQQVQFMLEALEQEVRIREANKKSRLLRRACFPVMKSFKGYDYGDIQLPPALGRQELEDAAFIQEKENLVLYGPVGTGKTHMAIAAGIRA